MFKTLTMILMFAIAAEAAQTTQIAGTWAIQDLQIANRLHIQFNVVGQNGNGSFNNSFSLDPSQLRGLPLAQIGAPIATITRFELVREAGTFVCEGYFKGGNGAGTFVFRPAPGFVSAMRAQGFLDVDEKRIFSMAAHDVGPRFAAQVRSEGITVSSASKLLSMRIHGVTMEFIRSVQQAGYKPEEEDLIKMRIHGVTPDFANEVRRMYAPASIEQLVRMRIHGVALDFAGEVRQLYPTASIDDLVRLRIHGVTMDYIRNAQSRSRNATLEQVVRMKIRGLD
jgi:hypothetical protein